MASSRVSVREFFVMRRQVGAHEPILVAVDAVQRRFGDTGSLDDAIDADRLHTALVEEVAGGIEQSLACGGRLATGFPDHRLDSITERSV